MYKVIREELKCEKCEKLFLRAQRLIEPYKQKYQDSNVCKYCISKISRQKRTNSNPLATKIENPSGGKNPYFSIQCQACNKTFIVPYMHRFRVFCGKTCQTNSERNIISNKKQLKCIICEKDFLAYGPRNTCSNYCNAEYMRKMRIGESNPNFKNDKNFEKKCLFCGQQFMFTRGGLHKGQERVFCSTSCSHEFQKNKPKNLFPVAQQIYDPNKYYGFYAKQKKQIRLRDKDVCCLCGHEKKQEEAHLPIHHIDYDTNNQDFQNLITLCIRCHGMTNSNKDFWTTVFQSMMSGSKLVKKAWGLEAHIVNNNKYCLKFLIFWSGQKFSLHTHHLKSELFYCLMGKFKCVLKKGDNEDRFLINAGDKIEINPGILHQVESLKNSVLLEVSTKDYPEDSYRFKSIL